MSFASIEAAADAIRRGEMVVVGDIVMAAEKVTAKTVNFMATHARGLICMPMLRERLDDLRIPPMVPADSTDPLGTAFHVSVDHASFASTGISATDRAATIRALASGSSVPEDFTKPGHVFPLAYREGGVLRRAGHTEAAIDLAMLAGLAPAAAICEIASADGEMARVPELLEFAARWNLRIVTITDLIAYRRHREALVARVGEPARLPTAHGDFRASAYRDHTGREHMALVLGDVRDVRGVLVRMHSECLTGDVFGSRRCDCGEQLDLAMKMIASEGCGAVVYLRGHEGRGIGLAAKIHAYRMQDGGLDTVEANIAIGQPVDGRDYGIGMQILNELGIREMRLLTNNPAKRAGLEAYGLKVTDRVPLVTNPTPENLRYLDTKRRKLGHLIAAAPRSIAADPA